MPPTYLRRSLRLQLTTFGDLFRWVPGASAMDRQRNSDWREMQNRISTIPSVKYWIFRKNRVVPLYVAFSRWSRRCSHKILSSLTITDNRRLTCEFELSSTSQIGRRSMPGRDYDSEPRFRRCPFIPLDVKRQCESKARRTRTPRRVPEQSLNPNLSIRSLASYS